jgi:pyruvate carboxylase subunit B
MLPEDTHIRIHTHDTAGIGVMQYKAALDAGVDGIDLAMKPVSGGTAQPDVITMWHALRGTDYVIDYDMDKVRKAEQELQHCLRDYFIPPEALAVEPMIPFSPMPGGALTANTQMMRDNQMMDRYTSVIENMGEVVRLGGFGTSVTPVSQFYFQQAFNNEIFGPWKRIAEGYGKMVLGYFGRTPTAPDPKIVELAQEALGLEPTTRCPREMNDEDPNKGLKAAEASLKEEGLPVTDENLFIAATCQAKGIAFLKGEGPLGVRKNVKESSAPSGGAGEGPVTVVVQGESFTVDVRGDVAIIDGVEIPVSFDEGASGGAVAGGSGGGTPVCAELAAKVFKIVAKPGDTVAEGGILLILEALKMEIEVVSPVAGRVQGFDVKVGQQVSVGDSLVSVG